MSTTRYSIACALKRALRNVLPVLGAGLLANVALAQVPQVPLTPQAPNVPAPNVPAPGNKAPDIKPAGEVNPPTTPATPATPKQNDPADIPPPPAVDRNKSQPDRKANDPAINVDPLGRKGVDVNVQSETTIKGNVDAQGRPLAPPNDPALRDNVDVRGRTGVDPNLRGDIDVRARTGVAPNVDPNLRGDIDVRGRNFNDGRTNSGYFYDPRGNYYFDGRGNYFYDGRWSNVVPPSSTMPQQSTITHRGRLGVTVVSRDGHLFVDEVFQGTPAANAGLQPNDELVAINGQRIRSYNELLALLDSGSRTNGQATLDFQRNGRIERATVDLAASSTYPAYTGRTETYYRGPYQNDRLPNYNNNYNNSWRNYDNGWNDLNRYVPRRDSGGRGNRGRW